MSGSLKTVEGACLQNAKKPREFKRYLEGKLVMSGEPLHAMKQLLAAFSRLTDEIPLQLEAHALLIRAMDHSSMQMAECIFPESVFREFHVGFIRRFRPASLPTRFSVKSNDILRAIRGLDEDAKVTIVCELLFARSRKVERVKSYRPPTCPGCGLEVNDDNNRRESNNRGKRGDLYTCANCNWRGKIRVRYRNVKGFEDKVKVEDSRFSLSVQGDVIEEYPLTLYVDVPETIPLPAMNFLTTQRLVTKEFHRKIRKLGQLKRFAITGSKEGIVIEGLWEDLGRHNQSDRGKIMIKKDSELLLESKGEEPQRAVFSMSYFEKLIRMSKGMSDVVDLEWSTDCPIKITWHVNALPGATVRFFLASEALKSGVL